MLRLTCNKKGFTLVEVMIATFLTVVAVLSIFALVAPAWRTTAQSDRIGRAANILYDHLQQQEAWIMNPCNAVTTGTVGPVAVNASGRADAQPGDMPFQVTRTITNIGTGVWRVSVRVAWPGSNGISESQIVTRQEYHRFPAGCADQ